MYYNEIPFPDIAGLNSIKQLIDNSLVSYLALIQYEDIIDTYILHDIDEQVLNQLAYYLFIAYDIRSFDTDNIKFINVYGHKLIDIDKCISIMNSYINQLVYDTCIDQSINSNSSLVC
jgi:hypothetical protein